MANGDYGCCCCCDDELAYNDRVGTKDTICVSCAAELAEQGIIVKSQPDFVSWVRTEDTERLRSVLTDLQFRRCLFPNAVDDLVSERLGKEFGRR